MVALKREREPWNWRTLNNHADQFAKNSSACQNSSMPLIDEDSEFAKNSSACQNNSIPLIDEDLELVDNSHSNDSMVCEFLFLVIVWFLHGGC